MRFQTLAEWLKWQESCHPKAIDLGLGRVREVFERLDPRMQIPFTITVGGTNGKGSCIAFLSAILRAQGYRVGAYTSPHLLRYNERIQVDGRPVSDELICEAFERVDAARQQVSLTYFEFGTLAALDIFSRSQLDVQLLEVGLGGRLDAVNILDTDAALVTCIEIDHSDWLGESRDAIGYEKAGIFRSGVPAVIGELEPPKSLLNYAQEHRLELSRYGIDFQYEKGKKSWIWSSRDKTLAGLPLPALRGEHQFLNASAVLQILSLIDERLPVSETSIRAGLESVSLLGRFQYIPGNPPILLDVAHNPQASSSLADYLTQEFGDRRIFAVFSIMRDKDIKGVISNTKDRISHWYIAPLEMSRSAQDGEIISQLSECGVEAYSSGFSDAAAAINTAIQSASNTDLVLVFGSFFLVAEFLKYYGGCADTVGYDRVREKSIIGHRSVGS